MVDRPAEQVEAGLLFLALELDPEHRTLAELTQRMSANDPHRREKEAGAVDQAAASLGDRTRKTTARPIPSCTPRSSSAEPDDSWRRI